VRTKHGVKGLTLKLQALGHKAVEIHSNLSLSRRKAALNGFKSKKDRILVATDVAARGLDINAIELVVNYNLPDNTEDYVHRIGRTGRAGQGGKAITFATPNEQKEIRDIERLINKSIKRTEYVKFSPEAKAAPHQSGKQGAKRKPFRVNSHPGSFKKYGQGGGKRHQAPTRRFARHEHASAK
jgi:superfamily II DNA/RNA helicase